MDIRQFPRSPAALHGDKKAPEEMESTLLATAKALHASKEREKKRRKGKPDIIIHREEGR